MKILFVVWEFYDERLEKGCAKCTGGTLVIRNICESIGENNDCYLFIGKHRLSAMKIGNIKIVNTILDNQTWNGVEDRIERHLQMMIEAFEKVIKEIQPDVVNFHGIGILAQRCMNVCRREKIPYVYTEHLYIGKKKIEKYEREAEWEQSLYRIPDLHVIAVSTGMKKRILKDFPEMKEDNIVVIKNGISHTAQIVKKNVKEKNGLKGKKILLCVGTIVGRKNQIQLVRAFSLLDQEVQNKIKVVFCGNDTMQGELQKRIEEGKLEDKLFYVGEISNEEMKNYYTIADGLVMPSLAEGLSIAALEAIAYGIPVIMFSDSECAVDLNDEKVVCFANNRNDRELAEAIAKWDKIEWDRDYIMQYSKKFTLKTMIENYQNYFKWLSENNNIE